MLALALALCSAARADNGVTADELRIGMANALTGPAAGLGLQLRAGASAYFDKINAGGGVNGRRIALVSIDDAYDPHLTAAATRHLIEQHKVFALFGYVGTPTSAVAVPIASRAGVPYLFPFSGAELLRHPVNPVVFNLRASYADEAEALVAQLAATPGMKRIALFVQDDAYGEAGKAGVLQALHKRGQKPVLEARYRRNTVEIGPGLDQLRRQPVDAVIFIGTYRPMATLVRQARAGGIGAAFLGVSFTGTSEFIKHAGLAAEGVIISQVMPSPDDERDALVRQYHADVLPAARNYGSLEGYANAMLLVDALQRCGREPSRAALLRTLEQMSTNLGGIQVRFGPGRHQGMDRVYLSRVKDGRAVPLLRQ